MSIAKEILTISNFVAAVAGGLIHKVGAYLYAEYKKAKAAESKIVADVKKDL